jgi:hypothetical protein
MRVSQSTTRSNDRQHRFAATLGRLWCICEACRRRRLGRFNSNGVIAAMASLALAFLNSTWIIADECVGGDGV